VTASSTRGKRWAIFNIYIFGEARPWHIFLPKITIWVNFGGSSNGRFWYGLLAYFVFMVIWYIFPFRYVCCTKKNLTTLC
jgi:hypothetical protein